MMHQCLALCVPRFAPSAHSQFYFPLTPPTPSTASQCAKRSRSIVTIISARLSRRHTSLLSKYLFYFISPVCWLNNQDTHLDTHLKQT